MSGWVWDRKTWRFWSRYQNSALQLVKRGFENIVHCFGLQGYILDADVENEGEMAKAADMLQAHVIQSNSYVTEGPNQLLKTKKLNTSD